ncbi:MAG: hypothetical protein AB1921_17050, partial [Thermodesulfobacteriota bacterium]
MRFWGRKLHRLAGLACIGALCLCCFGCSDTRTVASPGPDKARPPWIREAAFAADPSLSAHPDQVVILDLFTGLQAAAAHTIPYVFEPGDEGWRVLALDPGDPYLTRATLFDGAGNQVAAVTRGSGAVR